MFEGMDFFDCMNMANGDPIVAAMMHTDANRPAPKPKVVNGKRKILGGLLEIDEVKLAEYRKKQAEEEEKKKLEDVRRLGRHSVEYLQQKAERKKRLKRD